MLETDRPKTTPRDFFLYVGAMVTLYWSAGSLIALLFRSIDTVLRDQLEFYLDPYSSGIRFAIASLIVVFPISVILFRIIKREALADPRKLLLPIRRWLYALTIFITGAALAGDVIALLSSFLGGELTARFVLKVISVLVVAGLIFWFCLTEIRMSSASPARVRREFLYFAPLLVLAAIIYGFVVMGSPMSIRALRFDERRIQDLRSVQWQIVNYWQQKGRFPKSLADLEDTISGYRNPTDPRTKESYEFTLGEGYSFELCAAFELPSRSDSGALIGPHPIKARLELAYDENWEHAAGRVCFERTLDPERYPSRPKIPF